MPVSSQVLVYSQTSFQASKISQRNPRALYFNDTVAVGWIRGADLLEVTAQDSRQGTIFYSIPQQPLERPQFGRQEHCVSCHLTFDTLGVPGPTVRTTLPRKSADGFANGGPIDHRSPIADRWSGWFVTGTIVPEQHRGNVELIEPVPRTGPAPEPGERDWGVRHHRLPRRHQRHRRPDGARASGPRHEPDDASQLGVTTRRRLARRVRRRPRWPITCCSWTRRRSHRGSRALRLRGRVSARGPRDGKGRSLRDLALEGRLMRYPLSYTIYTPMFDALSDVCARPRGRAAGGRAHRARHGPGTRISAPRHGRHVGILRDTKPALAGALH